MTTESTPKHLPRLLSKADAAAYCGLTQDGFDGWVRTGKLPSAMPGTRRWDKVALDQAIDRLSGVSREASAMPERSALDDWRKKRDARRAAEAALDAKSISPFRGAGIKPEWPPNQWICRKGKALKESGS